MYLITFYQPFISDHKVVISEPMDFGSEEEFLKYVKDVGALKKDNDVYCYVGKDRYGNPATNEPPLYMKPIKINSFVSDSNLPASISFIW